MATSACISCKAPFPANRELATIPDASRIAFDPAHRRVWRICARCGEWNLLGTEASERALPELEARFAAAPKRAGGEGFAPAHVGSALELLQVGKTVAAVNDAVLRKRRRHLRLMKLIGGPVLVLCALGLVADGMLMYHWGVLSRMGIESVSLFPFMYLAYVVHRRHHRLPVKLWPVLPAVAMIVLGQVLLSRIDRLWFVMPIVLVPMYGIFALKLPPISFLTVRLLDGRIIRLQSSKDIKQMSISWNADGVLTLHGFPDGVEISGDEALPPLLSLIRGRGIVYVRRSVSDAAYDLVRTAGGLKGVLHALEGFRDDNSGRVVLADLPKVYLVALDLALARRELGDPPDDDSGIAAKSAEAAAIAAEAEALDQTMK